MFTTKPLMEQSTIHPFIFEETQEPPFTEPETISPFLEETTQEYILEEPHSFMEHETVIESEPSAMLETTFLTKRYPEFYYTMSPIKKKWLFKYILLQK